MADTLEEEMREVAQTVEEMTAPASTGSGDDTSVIYFYDSTSDLVAPGDYYLNNFHPSPFIIGDKLYPSVEHYYQSMKYADADPEYAEEIRMAADADTAKKMSRQREVPNLADWDSTRKFEVMKTALRAKYMQNPDLQAKLLGTGNRRLVEASERDALWGGLIDGSENRLGDMLMDLRAKLRKPISSMMMALKTKLTDPRSVIGHLKGSPALATAAWESTMHEMDSINDFAVLGTHQEVRSENSDQRRTYSNALAREEGSKMLNYFAGLEEATSARGVTVDSAVPMADRVAMLARISPFMYLPSAARQALANASTVRRYAKADLVATPNDEAERGECFVVVDGTIFAISMVSMTFLETVTPGNEFGIDYPFFGVRRERMVAGQDGALVLAFPSEALTAAVTPGHLFAQAVARNLRQKSHIFTSLEAFTTLVRDGEKTGSIDIGALRDRFTLIDSALHPGCNDEALDTDAWSYALARLPENILDTYIYLISTSLPDLFSHPNLTHAVKSTLRARGVFNLHRGKSLIVLRDLETDLLDFCANLCIHLVEARKLRRRISSPRVVGELMHMLEAGAGNAEVTALLAHMNLSEKEQGGILKIFGDETTQSLLDIILHHEDYRIYVDQPRQWNIADPAERWTERLAHICKSVLEVPEEASFGEGDVPDLVVDIIQGSTRTTINCLSSWVFENKEKIEGWAEDTNLELITQSFHNEDDKLFAKKFHYLQAHPEAKVEKAQADAAAGMTRITETVFTGVQVLIVDANKVDKNFHDSSFEVNPASPNHLIINIGYTFGSQSADIMRCMIMLFGRYIRSINVIGKAGGLCGSRGDIMLATSIMRDATDDIVSTHCEDVNVETLGQLTARDVHVGPMLTVAGTILQNEALLLFFRRLWGCVGLEMEGIFHAAEIKRSMELGFLPPGVKTRFMYYSSDLPLDPNSNLSHEGDVVSWDEGIAPLTGMVRHVLQLIFANN